MYANSERISYTNIGRVRPLRGPELALRSLWFEYAVSILSNVYPKQSENVTNVLENTVNAVRYRFVYTARIRDKKSFVEENNAVVGGAVLCRKFRYARQIVNQ